MDHEIEIDVIEDVIKRELSILTGIDISQINEQLTLEDYELDSLKAASFTTAVCKKLDIEIPSDEIFLSNSIKSLIQDLKIIVRSKSTVESSYQHLSENFRIESSNIISNQNNDFLEIVKEYSSFFSKNDSFRFYQREIVTAMENKVIIKDRVTSQTKQMIMFGSNNYFGLANHPLVKKRVIETIETFGVGIAGPPLLNGYTHLHRQLEEKLSTIKGMESTMLFGSGYSANLGLAALLCSNANNLIIYDELCHASFIDGLSMSSASPSIPFEHNNMEKLEEIVKKVRSDYKNIFVVAEGLYSMDGDIVRLNELIDICQRYCLMSVIDDAHGTLVLGDNRGGGVLEYFNAYGKVDIIIGTFSKAFAMTGGFISASNNIINYLRMNVRSYIFSASLPITTIGAILAGLEVIYSHPELKQNLLTNISYLATKLSELNIRPINNTTPIFCIPYPISMDTIKANQIFHDMGVFVNSILYPAVPKNKERFRISLMATHTKEDINQLLSAISKIWQTCQLK